MSFDIADLQTLAVDVETEAYPPSTDVRNPWTGTCETFVPAEV
ncbi:hypothetical protein [Streptomyces sp. NPDC058701]